MSKHGFVYIWYDRKHKRYYIGCRWGKETDGYICSSPWMKAAYRRRPEDFKRRILETDIHDRQTLLEREYAWLQLTKKEELAGPRYYNLHNHKFNHWSVNPLTRAEIAQQSSVRNKGKSFSPTTQFKSGECRSPETQFKKGQTPHNKGQSTSVETRAKQSAAKKGKPSTNLATQFKPGNGTGASNVNARAIQTPFGQFSTLTECSNQTGISIASIHYKLRTPKHTHWAYC